MSAIKTALLRAYISRFIKTGGVDPTRLTDALSYGAFLAAQAVPHEKMPKLHTALEVAGLGGLLGSTGYRAATGGDAWKPALKDGVGLALMGSALYDRLKNPH